LLITFDGKTPQVGNNCFIAPTATLIGDVVIEDQVSIWFGAVLRGDFGRIIVRKGSSIQDNVVVHVIPDCETVIGEAVTVAHGVILHGCTIDKGAIIGMGAVVQDFSHIGEEAMIAAGTVVPSNMQVPPRHLAAGDYRGFFNVGQDQRLDVPGTGRPLQSTEDRQLISRLPG